MSLSIFQTLEKLGLTSNESKLLYNQRTRDVDSLKVWKDSISEVIYIDEFYTGDNTYIDGSYRNDKILFSDKSMSIRQEYETILDSQRRAKDNLKYVKGKSVGDFGCGSGDFLKLVEPSCTKVLGIELQRDYVNHLNSIGIDCLDDHRLIEDQSLDIIVSFHVIEHLPHPIETLCELKAKIKKGGHLLIEVPHARDFLLSYLLCEEFKQFTLWSQHLILHTRQSLYKFLKFVGFEDIQIFGTQRYPLSNHLNWLANGKPGGHKSKFSVLDSDILFNSYKDSLDKIDATDTLVAIAKVN